MMGGVTAPGTPPASAGEDFPAALAARLRSEDVSQRGLAKATGYDASYVSHVLSRRRDAAEVFARGADQVLGAGGDLMRAWRNDGGAGRDSLAETGVTVIEDHAELRYNPSDGTGTYSGVYTAAQRRVLYNAGPEPVTRWLMRISVDRYPGQPDRSNALYRQRPLRWDELHLTATCDGQPMTWQVKVDRDAVKEIWLLFANSERQFPLYPGQKATLKYSYQVDDGRWGPWFQRAVRHPTVALSVDLTFPAAAEPAVWGTETSTSAEAVPLRTPLTRHVHGDPHGNQVTFRWSIDEPPLGARYRLGWAFPGAPEEPQPDLRTASDRMRAAGIIQHGDPILNRPARPFDLPAEAADAADVVEQIHAAIARVREHHTFAKGMGLAAVQLGIDRAAAVIVPPDDSDPIVLLNPRTVGAAADVDVDEQYEGCLSDFDVRGMVPRPRQLEVEHTLSTGDRRITVFRDGLARLAAHEIDHLAGILYTDRMRPGVEPIPVELYRGTGRTWTYDHGERP